MSSSSGRSLKSLKDRIRSRRGEVNEIIDIDSSTQTGVGDSKRSRSSQMLPEYGVIGLDADTVFGDDERESKKRVTADKHDDHDERESKKRGTADNHEDHEVDREEEQLVDHRDIDQSNSHKRRDRSRSSHGGAHAIADVDGMDYGLSPPPIKRERSDNRTHIDRKIEQGLHGRMLAHEHDGHGHVHGNNRVYVTGNRDRDGVPGDTYSTDTAAALAVSSVTVSGAGNDNSFSNSSGGLILGTIDKSCRVGAGKNEEDEDIQAYAGFNEQLRALHAEREQRRMRKGIGAGTGVAVGMPSSSNAYANVGTEKAKGSALVATSSRQSPSPLPPLPLHLPPVFHSPVISTLPITMRFGLSHSSVPPAYTAALAAAAAERQGQEHNVMRMEQSPPPQSSQQRHQNQQDWRSQNRFKIEYEQRIQREEQEAEKIDR